MVLKSKSVLVNELEEKLRETFGDILDIDIRIKSYCCKTIIHCALHL